MSLIAGRGLFTTGEIARGEHVDVDVELLNHSCDPTLAWSADGVRLESFRDLSAGEELAVDYATSSGDPEMLVRCHCETYRCRQMVTGDDWQIPQVQQRYAGHFAAAVQSLIDRSRASPARPAQPRRGRCGQAGATRARE